jgi:hypothetical protein
MSNTTATAPVTTSKRIKYGFTLNFPSKPFTLKSLTSTGNHPAYITAYKRLRKAMSDGTITIVGAKTPKNKRRGARELIYSRINAESSILSTQLATAPV